MTVTIEGLSPTDHGFILHVITNILKCFLFIITLYLNLLPSSTLFMGSFHGKFSYVEARESLLTFLWKFKFPFILLCSAYRR